MGAAVGFGWDFRHAMAFTVSLAFVNSLAVVNLMTINLSFMQVDPERDGEGEAEGAFLICSRFAPQNSFCCGSSELYELGVHQAGDCFRYWERVSAGFCCEM